MMSVKRVRCQRFDAMNLVSYMEGYSVITFCLYLWAGFDSWVQNRSRK